MIHDPEVIEMLNGHLKDLAKTSDSEDALHEAREIMAKRIFSYHLKQDIICLQEANYLHADLFPSHYEVSLEGSHSPNGVAWNTQRFECLEKLGDVMGRGIVFKLLDKKNQQTVVVASGHITGCNPYCREENPETGEYDSDKGDGEIQAIIDLLESQEADIKLIGMDSNVTALHPRLKLLKDAGYQLDYENYLEPTCASPYQVLNTRIDWIASKGAKDIKNVPVLNVHLNNLQTNMSDHKPIAAKIE